MAILTFAMFHHALQPLFLSANIDSYGSVMTGDEPVHTDLGLETLKCRRDFHRVKWYSKVVCMNSNRLLVKLLLNKWDNVKFWGCPRKSWVARESLGLPR